MKLNIPLISAARRRNALDSAELIKIMQLFERRHPEVRVRIDLPIEPGRTALVKSDAHEIGSCTVGMTPVGWVTFAIAAATIE
jgi:hypothetical protein